VRPAECEFVVVSAKPESPLLAAVYLDIESALLLMRTLGIRSTPLALGLYAVVLDVESTPSGEAALRALFDSGLIDENGNVDSVLAEWLQVLGDPDVIASASARIGGRKRYTVVARKGTDHVLAFRIDDEIVLQSIMSPRRTVDDLVVAPLWDALRLSKEDMDPPPVEMQSITFIREVAQDPSRKHAGSVPREIKDAMNKTGRTGQILKELTASTEGQRCRIMIQQRYGNNKVHSPSAVLVADTRFGRVVSGTRRVGSKMVTTLGDGTYGRFRTAICDLIAMTPSKDWFTVRQASGQL
jgi:EspG family